MFKYNYLPSTAPIYARVLKLLVYLLLYLFNRIHGYLAFHTQSRDVSLRLKIRKKPIAMVATTVEEIGALTFHFATSTASIVLAKI